MRQKTVREKRTAGTILMVVGILEFSVGIVIWYAHIPIPLHYLFWTVGTLLFLWGRNWRKH